jgi:hypothetical protein
MCKRLHRRSIPVAGFALCLIVGSCPLHAQSSRRAQLQGAAATTPTPAPGVLPQPAIAPGSEARALDYYKLLSQELALGTQATFADTHTMQELLTYCGYEKLLATDIERLASAVLMDYAQLKAQVSNSADFKMFFGDPPAANDPVTSILSARYFTPKIVDVSEANPPGPNRAFGWRRVVRLKVRPGSGAAMKQIAAVFILFNHFAKLNQDPFATSSVNNQAILVHETAARDRPVYWLVYEPLNDPMKPGRVKTYLDASFDASVPNPGSITKYYVPDACAQCHGGGGADPMFRFRRARLNTLNSDHWYDRIQNHEDFPEIQYGTFGPFYDGGKDVDTNTYRTAFDKLRDVNKTILEQNEAIDLNLPMGAAPSFQVVAMRKWADLHATDSRPRPLLERALKRGMTDPVWSVSNPNDVRLLAELNQYCFRCHSSFLYDVFDKKAVKQLGIGIQLLVTDDVMPQDRRLTPTQKTDFLKLIDVLLQEP